MDFSNPILNEFEPEVMEHKIKNYEVPFEGLNILLIDDDVQLCDSLKFYFEDHECNVSIENDGGQGIETFEAGKYDLVFVDLNMPKIDGHQVISHISRNYPDTPVIVVSGTGEIQSAIRAIQLGAWDFITKPILEFEVLELSVHRALEKVQLIEENKAYKKNLERLVEQRTKELEDKTEELERTNVELVAAKIQAEQADKLKTEFLSQVSHEIRTPINSMLSFASILQNDLYHHLSEEMKTGFSIIERSGLRIIRTIDLLIDVSQVLSGTYEKRLCRADIVEMLETCAYEHRQKITSDIKLETSCKVDECLTLLDTYSFSQILNNLLDNSVKFTKQGEIKLCLKCNNSKIAISIEDTGIGMTPEYLNEIFLPFSQEDKGYSRSYEGNGLGMTLVKQFCDLNNIDIQIASKKGEGTRIQLLFDKD